MDIQRHQPDYVLYFTVLILCAVGVVTVYSASTVWAINHQLPTNHLALRQLTFALAGGVLMTVLMMWIPYQWLFKRAVPLMLINLVLLSIVLVPGIGVAKLGSRRWIGHGSLLLQPSEIAIVLSIIYLGYFFTKKIPLVNDFKHGLRPALIIVLLQVGLVFIEPDMGTALTLLGTSLTVVFASGATLKKLIIPAILAVPVLIFLANAATYRSQRISAWLHPFANASSSSYQLLQGWTGIAAGGWFGRGFGMSLEKTGYLPIPQADFIFPVFTEEWGFVGALALLMTFAVLIWRGFRIARHTPDRFSALLAVGITSMIVIKALINLGAVTGLLPVTGIPLPFISYGGTALLVNMMAMGILLNISRHALTFETNAEELADVIAVDEARSLRAESGPPPDPAADDKSRPVAQVHHLRTPRTSTARTRPTRTRETSRASTASPQHNWRSRQESAATKEKRRTTSKDTNTRTSGLTWRERQAHDTNKPTDKDKSNSRSGRRNPK